MAIHKRCLLRRDTAQLVCCGAYKRDVFSLSFGFSLGLNKLRSSCCRTRFQYRKVIPVCSEVSEVWRSTFFAPRDGRRALHPLPTDIFRNRSTVDRASGDTFSIALNPAGCKNFCGWALNRRKSPPPPPSNQHPSTSKRQRCAVALQAAKAVNKWVHVPRAQQFHNSKTKSKSGVRLTAQPVLLPPPLQSPPPPLGQGRKGPEPLAMLGLGRNDTTGITTQRKNSGQAA